MVVVVKCKAQPPLDGVFNYFMVVDIGHQYDIIFKPLSEKRQPYIK